MFRAFTLSTALLLPAAVFAAMPMPASTYVMKAGAGDLFEIKSSKLVMNSANPKVQDFARMMVTDHTQSTADVKQAALKAGLHPKPPVLSPEQSMMIAKLTSASGAERDQLYIDQQKTAHDQALALHEGYSTDGMSAPLKMAAAKIVPVVKTHIQMLAAM